MVDYTDCRKASPICGNNTIDVVKSTHSGCIRTLCVFVTITAKIMRILSYFMTALTCIHLIGQLAAA